MHAATLSSAGMQAGTGGAGAGPATPPGMTLVSLYRSKVTLSGGAGGSSVQCVHVVLISPVSLQSVVVLTLLTSKGAFIGQVRPVMLIIAVGAVSYTR